MSAERISMRTVKEITRLTYENGLSRRQVAQSVALARASITDYLRRFEAFGLTWRAAAALDDVPLERRLFPSACPDLVPQRPEPDWATVHQELRRKGVTLMLLSHESRRATRRAISTVGSATRTGPGRAAAFS